MNHHSDIIIIGAGIIGCAVARELSRYNTSIIVLERASDIAEGATKANSGLVHAGFDALPGTQKAFYNVRGASMYPDLCLSLGVPYRQNGALVVALSEADRPTVETLRVRGEQNGVRNLSILGHDELLKMEPALNPEAVCALYAPTSAIVSPYELAFALADDAALNGVSFCFDQAVSSVSLIPSGGFSLRTTDNHYTCRVLVNCAGASGADISNQLSSRKLHTVYRRGQYYLLDRAVSQPFTRTVFQCPSALGKGVLVTPTVHGNLLLGPTAEDIADPLDTATTSGGLSEVLRKAVLTWPALSVRSNITNFSGVRAHLLTDDFIVGPCEDVPDYFEAIGIESPGLSSAPAIGESLSLMIASSLSLSRKTEIVSYPFPAKSFHDMNYAERMEAVKQDPAYGQIICRCETVTEAEIRAALRRPVPARSIDGIKRRTRAGMGRCQGGFCLPRVAAIIAEEMDIPLTEITKNGGSSRLLAGDISSFLKEDKEYV